MSSGSSSGSRTSTTTGSRSGSATGSGSGTDTGSTKQSYTASMVSKSKDNTAGSTFARPFSYDNSLTLARRERSNGDDPTITSDMNEMDQLERSRDKGRASAAQSAMPAVHCRIGLLAHSNSLDDQHIVLFMRAGERVDRTQPDWLNTCFQQGKYCPENMNLPLMLPDRGDEQAYQWDSPLTTQGIWQAQLVGRGLRVQQLPVVAVFASPAFRAVQTAYQVVQQLNRTNQNKVLICIEPGLFESSRFHSKTGHWPQVMQPEQWKAHGYPIDLTYKPQVPMQQFSGQQCDPIEPTYARIRSTIDMIVRSQSLVRGQAGALLIVGHAITIDAGYRGLLQMGAAPLVSTDVVRLGVHYPPCTVLAVSRDCDRLSDAWQACAQLLPPTSHMNQHNQPQLTFAHRQQAQDTSELKV